METRRQLDREVLITIFKDYSNTHTISTLSKQLKSSRVGVWKVLQKLKHKEFVILQPIGSGVTSTIIVKPNLDNPLVAKNLSLYLTEDASNHQRWTKNFAPMENLTIFVIIYGSILTNPKTAHDIDILHISKKDKFDTVENALIKVQMTLDKKIHSIGLTETELKNELKRNQAFNDAIRKGVILFGQEKFINFIRGIYGKDT